jgi:colicin import membrane protein
VAQQETSALFSLKELMRIEETRIQEEREQRRRQTEAAERAQQEAARAAREREAARVRLEEERRLDDARRVREEAARLEAVRAAEVERARVEATERAKTEALSAQRVHEQRLAAIGAGETKKRLRWATWFGAAACVALVAGGAGLYYGQIKPSADERTRGLEAIIAQRRAQTEEMQRAIDAQNRRLQELQDQMREEKQPTAPPADVKPATPKVSGSHKGNVRSPPPPPKPCTCDPHDPLCGCFAPR